MMLAYERSCDEKKKVTGKNSKPGKKTKPILNSNELIKGIEKSSWSLGSFLMNTHNRLVAELDNIKKGKETEISVLTNAISDYEKITSEGAQIAEALQKLVKASRKSRILYIGGKKPSGRIDDRTRKNKEIEKWKEELISQFPQITLELESDNS